MSLLDKDYFTLEEIVDRWRLPHRDVVYLAENGLLRLSVRLFGVPMERTCFSGLRDLRESDAFRLFRDGQVRIDQLAAPEGEYCYLLEPTRSVLVRLSDIVVRKEERDRVERRHRLVRGGTPQGPALRQFNAYSEVHLGGLVFQLGPIQARVVKLLHKAAQAGEPWCIGKLVLGEAGSACTRMADLFKSQPHWRRLIESDGRGRYRLSLPLG